MAKQIKTNISIEEYEFLDAKGNHLFTISFNPADIDIARRYDKVVEYLHEAAKKKLETQEALFELGDGLKEKLDGLFNADISTAIFSVMNPFTPLANGKLYVEEIVEQLGKVIEAEMNIRLKKVQSRQNKYTAKYHK